MRVRNNATLAGTLVARYRYLLSRYHDVTMRPPVRPSAIQMMRTTVADNCEGNTFSPSWTSENQDNVVCHRLLQCMRERIPCLNLQPRGPAGARSSHATVQVSGEKKRIVLRRDSSEVKERYFFSSWPAHRRWTMSGPREQPHSGQFFAGSRVSLVCNVCSRLLPKEWFAERPMASARANSRVPPPRHLCIIMLSPRTPALFSRALTLSLFLSSPLFPSLAAPPVTEKSAPPLPPCRRPSTSFALRPLASPAPTLSHFLSTLVSLGVGETERERGTGRRRRNIPAERERKKRNEEKRLGGALCQSG